LLLIAVAACCLLLTLADILLSVSCAQFVALVTLSILSLKEAIDQEDTNDAI